MYLNIKSYFIFLLLSLSILSCSDSVSPDEIDPRLIGEWYRADIIQSDTLSPDVSFHGIQINADKTIKLLGVEIIEVQLQPSLY